MSNVIAFSNRLAGGSSAAAVAAALEVEADLPEVSPQEKDRIAYHLRRLYLAIDLLVVLVGDTATECPELSSHALAAQKTLTRIRQKIVLLKKMLED